MEGVGSRFGRASSRYGPATVFSGPVRKWKKQWVHVSQSASTSTISYQNNNNNSSSRSNNNVNGNNNNNNSSSALLLCRWTPISPSHTAADSVKPEEPPRRKFRYTPIVVLEEQKKEAAEKVDDKVETSRAHSLTTGTTSKSDDAYEKPDTGGKLMEENQAADKNQLARQDSTISHLNLDLGLKGNDENHESDGENKEKKLVRVSSGGFWA